MSSPIKTGQGRTAALVMLRSDFIILVWLGRRKSHTILVYTTNKYVYTVVSLLDIQCSVQLIGIRSVL